MQVTYVNSAITVDHHFLLICGLLIVLFARLSLNDIYMSHFREYLRTFQ
jgi:uncharacterized membrane protein